MRYPSLMFRDPQGWDIVAAKRRTQCRFQTRELGVDIADFRERRDVSSNEWIEVSTRALPIRTEKAIATV